MTTTQQEMIKAAQQVATLMPPKPAWGLLADRTEQLVYSTFLQAAIGAYRRAAQECLNAAYDAVGGGIDLEAAHAIVADASISLGSLIEMCTAGYAWGGRVVTLSGKSTNNLTVGQKVTTSGFPGVIVRQYSPGMYEVRLASGLVCVDISDIKPV